MKLKNYLSPTVMKKTLVEEEKNKFWLKDVHKEIFVLFVTEYLQQADPHWNKQDSVKLVDAVEKSVFQYIDVQKLLGLVMSRDGFTFSFNVVQNVCSDELFDLLLEYHPEKWRFIHEMFMLDGKVDLIYEDRYVNSPLGCLLLAQFIRRIRDLFKLSYRSIEIILSKKDFRVIFDDDKLKIDRKFSFPENRDSFLRLCMDEIVSEPYKLKVKNLQHARTLIIRNSKFQLSICPDAGISYGWGVENGVHRDLTIDVLKKNLDLNINCFNRAAHSFDREGII